MASLPEHLMPAAVSGEQLSREVIAEHQRAKVLAAATEVFAKRGYQATTVDHIVSAASIGVGSFYALFDGKQACFLAAYDQIVAAGKARVAEATPPGADWPEKLGICLRVLLEMIEEEPFSARIALVEVQTAGAEALAHHERNLDEAAAQLRWGREHSNVAGELPEALEFATIGGLTWFLQQRVAVGATADATKLLPEVLEIAAEPYLGERATAALAARVALR